MEKLSLHATVGNHYKPSPLLAQVLSERFQVPVSDFGLGILCLSPIGDCVKKAQYKTIHTITELEDGSKLQTSELVFTHWEENSGDGLFKLALSRYEFKKVRTVRVSKKDLDMVLRMEHTRRDMGLSIPSKYVDKKEPSGRSLLKTASKSNESKRLALMEEI